MNQNAMAPSSPPLRLRLYIAGESPNSRRAVVNLNRILEDHFADRFDLEVVDALGDPLKPINDGVLVTPTLIRLEPGPPVAVVGDLSDTDRVLLVLKETA